MADDETVDAIYEAALVPDLWPGVLARLSAGADCFGGTLFALNASDYRWTASSDLYPKFQKFIEEGWLGRNPRGARTLARNHAGFLSDLDLFTSDEIEAEPMYGYLRSIGLGWGMGSLISCPSGRRIVVTFEKEDKKGPVESSALAHMDALRPHIARAAVIASLLGLEKARGASDTLGAIGFPSGVLSDSLRLLHANKPLESLMPGVIRATERGRATLADSDADDLFARTKFSATSMSIPIRGTDMSDVYVLHLIPIRRGAHDIFSSAAYLFVIMSSAAAGLPSAAILEALYHLTPSEATIARGVAAGLQIDDIAEKQGVSRETVRGNLKSVFSKTGTHRQAELVARLKGLGLPG